MFLVFVVWLFLKPNFIGAAEVYVPYEKTAVYRPTEEVIEQTAIEYEKSRPKHSPSKVKSYGLCSCVAGVNAHFGTNFKTLDGFARSITTNSKTPAQSGFVITYESMAGHIAHYYLLGDKIIIDYETNYERCQMSSGRELNPKLVKGFIN